MQSLRNLFLSVLLGLPTLALAVPEPAPTAYACGQEVEQDVWRLWDQSAKSQIADQLVGERMTRQGDTYALYDIQTYLHNLVAMAGRCGRTDRLLEVARVLRPVFAELRAAPRGKGEAWVCRGGPICNERNRSLGGEVQLASVQFLGLASSVAARLATTQGDEAADFRRTVAKTALAHLARWSSPEAFEQIRKKSMTRAVTEAPDPGLAFEDKQLWMIAIYANLAHLAANDQRVAGMIRSSAPAPDRFALHLASLLQLFQSRLSIDPPKDGAGAPSADIDRGFWRANKDNRYAGYADAQKPVECIRRDRGRAESVVKVEADRAVPLDGSGWDLSHARRLVHALDAIDLGRDAMPSAFGISASALPRGDLREMFASQLVHKVWNNDPARPLFRNFWGGANGWYRVDYDNGTGRCNEGTPPYGLSMAFVTGGYSAWGARVPEVGQLGRRIRSLSQSDEPDAKGFVTQYYSDLLEPEGSLKGTMTRLMFWPSLVYNADKTSPKAR